MLVSLAEARLLLANARRAIEQGDSPSRAKVEKRVEANEGVTFGGWAEKYFAEVKLAESTRAMRRAVYDRNLATEFGRLKLEEITPSRLMARCEKIKERGAPAPAVQSRDIVLQIFRFVQAIGLRIENPAEAIRPSAIAAFKVRDRALSPEEIHKYFNALEEVSSAATLRLAVKFMLLTMVRKSEFTQAKWEDVDFEAGVWTIPKERMKAGREHSVPLSQTAWDVLQQARGLRPDDTEPTGLIFPGTKNKPISDMTLTQLLRRMQQPYTVHGFRASFRTWGADIAHYEHDMLEIALSHIVGDATVRAYHRSDMLEKRRKLMSEWALYLSLHNTS